MGKGVLLDVDRTMSELLRLLYRDALITVLWYIEPPCQDKATRRHLIYSSVELIPNYWGNVSETAEQTVLRNCLTP